jgi:hypothetical protein
LGRCEVAALYGGGGILADSKGEGVLVSEANEGSEDERSESSGGYGKHGEASTAGANGVSDEARSEPRDRWETRTK